LETGKDKVGARGNIKKSNIVDNESAKMASAHGVIQGYNGVAAVDSKHQVIIHAEAFGEGQETKLLRPMLDGVRGSFSQLGHPGVLGSAVVVADNGYHSEENLHMLEVQGIEAYIPDTLFRKRDPAFAEASRYRKPVDRRKTRRAKRYFQPSDFLENRRARKAICPAGKELYLKNRNFKDPDGRTGIAYIGKKTDCRVCVLRTQCLRHSHTEVRQVTFFSGRREDGKKTFSRKMIERIDTAEGRFLYSQRMGIVEPVFGNVCSTLGLNRFLLRGRIKVDIQWKLFAIVHNLLKIARYGPRFA
jgi:hypothetical protein